ncbi:MAG TPA: hypothetical protein VN706_05605 [Gemmatimonadaceae bacterium]|nr:hypothetical protein [Gemmatimonadaceae bacterium]
MRIVHRSALLGLCIAGSFAQARRLPAQDHAIGHFTLDVRKSGFLKEGASRLETTSAVVTYTSELMRGRVNALKIQLFVPRLTAAEKARLVVSDMGVPRSALAPGRGVLVLLVDDKRRVTQANLTIETPGTTVSRTVAYRRTELEKSFGDVRYANGRLRMKSKGTYATGVDSPGEVFTMSWNLDLDVPVVDRSGTAKKP